MDSGPGDSVVRFYARRAALHWLNPDADLRDPDFLLAHELWMRSLAGAVVRVSS